jgi:pimeloyl-ACP methyl ester carboxylesterase
VTCFPTAAEEAAAMSKLPAFPLGRAQERQFTATMATVAASCERTSPDRLAHFSTANVARDMDLLRQAVGDEKLTYVGYSYGTYLGATYAKLFPRKVRALVLDGTWFPSEYSGTPGDPRPVGVRLGQGPAAAKTFEQFKAECKRAGASRCALAGLGDPDTVAEGLLERLKKKPVVLPGPNGPFEVTYDAMVRSTFTSLYQPDLWTDLAAAFAEVAQAAKATETAQSAQTKAARLSARSAALLQPNQRQEDYPSFGSLLQNCVEAYTPMQPGAYPAWAAAVDKVAPHFGRMRTWQSVQCETMPTRDRDAFRGPWTKLKVSEPVLVIGTRYDPATPYADTRPYAELYRDARMVTVEGFGHTTLGKSTCADKLITDYLTSLKAPADGSTCTQDRKPFTSAPTKTKPLQGPGGLFRGPGL